jgi:hypothetical protein
MRVPSTGPPRIVNSNGWISACKGYVVEEKLSFQPVRGAKIMHFPRSFGFDVAGRAMTWSALVIPPRSQQPLRLQAGR